MRHLVKDALESRSLIRCRRVNGGDVVTGRIRKWIESGSNRDDGPFLTRIGLKSLARMVWPEAWYAAEPRQYRPCRNEDGLWECPDGDPGALGHFLLEGISGVCESMG